MASFMALNIDQFPRSDDGNSTQWLLNKASSWLCKSHLPPIYISIKLSIGNSKYSVGITFAISVPFIVIALYVTRLSKWTRKTTTKFLAKLETYGDQLPKPMPAHLKKFHNRRAVRLRAASKKKREREEAAEKFLEAVKPIEKIEKLIYKEEPEQTETSSSDDYDDDLEDQDLSLRYSFLSTEGSKRDGKAPILARLGKKRRRPKNVA